MRTKLIVATLVAYASLVAAQQAGGPADLILVNGRVYTVDAARPWAEAVAIRGSRIVAIGTNADARLYTGAGTRTIDVKGAFVSPGARPLPLKRPDWKGTSPTSLRSFISILPGIFSMPRLRSRASKVSSNRRVNR